MIERTLRIFHRISVTLPPGRFHLDQSREEDFLDRSREDLECEAHAASLECLGGFLEDE
jgi:hypothetical protein